jgi:hypothetical protein
MFAFGLVIGIIIVIGIVVGGIFLYKKVLKNSVI